MPRNSNRTIKAILVLSVLRLSGSAQTQIITGKMVGVMSAWIAEPREPT